MASARPPAASICRAVVSRLPGMGSPRVDPDSSNASPSRTVRAVMATSRPAAARATAEARPIPRLAPVTSATRRSQDTRSESSECPTHSHRSVHPARSGRSMARSRCWRPATARQRSARAEARPGIRSGGCLLATSRRSQLAPLALVGPGPVPHQIRDGEGIAQALRTHRASCTQLLGTRRGTTTVGNEHLDTLPPTGAHGLPARSAQQLDDHRRDALGIGLVRGPTSGLCGHCEAGHVQTFDTPTRGL